jgi:phosphoribosylaminoimidazolecarboxamide formyltransferase/IMP cyclohydrolase
MQEHGIDAIDLLVVNLYPFEKTVANPGTDLETAIENIDIGGPAMLRAASKNYKAVSVLTDSSDYQRILDELSENSSGISEATRYDLAIKTFEHTARYDGAIANYFGCLPATGEKEEFPRTYSIQVKRYRKCVMVKIPISAQLFMLRTALQKPVFRHQGNTRVNSCPTIIWLTPMRHLSALSHTIMAQHALSSSMLTPVV